MSTDKIERKLSELREAGWVVEMKRHYALTGTYRQEDLRRLLGDPKRGVESGPRASMAKYFLSPH